MLNIFANVSKENLWFGLGGFAVGSAATYGVVKLAQKRQHKKMAENFGSLNASGKPDANMKKFQAAAEKAAEEAFKALDAAEAVEEAETKAQSKAS